MPFKVMEALGLKVDTKKGRCRGMDAREVLVIGTINALPFRLVAYPEVELTMSVLVVDIPPHYGMFLSRKWSATMGGSLQYDLTYANFHIGDKVFKVNREPRVSHILGKEIDKDATCFLDTSVNAFRSELIIQEVEKVPTIIEHEVECFLNSPLLWTIFLMGLVLKMV